MNLFANNQPSLVGGKDFSSTLDAQNSSSRSPQHSGVRDGQGYYCALSDCRRIATGGTKHLRKAGCKFLIDLSCLCATNAHIGSSTAVVNALFQLFHPFALSILGFLRSYGLHSILSMIDRDAVCSVVHCVEPKATPHRHAQTVASVDLPIYAAVQNLSAVHIFATLNSTEWW